MRKNMKLTILTFLSITFFVGFFNIDKDEYIKIATSNIDKYNPKRKDYVIIVDYRKSIMSERLFVLDMIKEEIVISSRVSHAWNSGFLYASDFSNKSGSNKSSKGTFITEGTKHGRFGYSMVINGLDSNVNNNARSRAVIFHSTKKMSNPWSNGCFATSDEINNQIIDLTKNGCLVIVID
jgi:hypothetical protein